MSITVIKMDGTTEVVEPILGSCREALIELGIYSGPPTTIEVTSDGQDVSDLPISQFDCRKLTIQPIKAVGGA